MEMVPYNCIECGGAYKRCAYGGHVPAEDVLDPTKNYTGPLVPCKGGKLCWERHCVIQAVHLINVPTGCPFLSVTSIPVLDATYDGYGIFLINDEKYTMYEFVTHERVLGDTFNKEKYVFLVDATCNSCYSCPDCIDSNPDKPSKLILCEKHYAISTLP